LSGSVVVSVHVPPQLVWAPTHVTTQMPDTQVWPVPQSVPHNPQWPTFVCRSTQLPPQVV
jgi:hypothetical protein